MKKFHVAIATRNLDATIQDYTERMECVPCVVVPDQYALWRTASLNVSVRQDLSCPPGEVRHLGWEDPDANSFTADTDVNGMLWERFSAQVQADEIEEIWPGTGYAP